MIVLQHVETKKYVARPGNERSYTRKLEDARQFRSHEEAERERCVESERIVEL